MPRQHTFYEYNSLFISSSRIARYQGYRHSLSLPLCRYWACMTGAHGTHYTDEKCSAASTKAHHFHQPVISNNMVSLMLGSEWYFTKRALRNTPQQLLGKYGADAVSLRAIKQSLFNKKFSRDVVAAYMIMMNISILSRAIVSRRLLICIPLR